MIAYPRSEKNDWSTFLQVFKIQFQSQKHAYHAEVEAFWLVKKENKSVRHSFLKVEILVKQGWYNAFPSNMNLKCKEIVTGGFPENLKDFANKS